MTAATLGAVMQLWVGGKLGHQRVTAACKNKILEARCHNRIHYFQHACTKAHYYVLGISNKTAMVAGR